MRTECQFAAENGARPDPAQVLAEVEALTARVEAEAARLLDRWRAWDLPEETLPSAANFAAYLALRHEDLRPLQRSLMALGLSSLGRAESRVLASLAAVRAALVALTGGGWQPAADPEAYFAGEAQLAARAHRMFGPPAGPRRIAILVTCPSTAADDPDFMMGLAERRVEAIRINCAHDGPAEWGRMIDHARAAQAATGHRLRVFMDIAGPKIRTGRIVPLGEAERVMIGDRIAIVPTGRLDAPLPGGIAFVAECTLDEVIRAARPGDRLYIADGSIQTRIESVEDGIVIAEVTRCKAEGTKLKPEKGINVPDTELRIPALTDRDREDLAFIASHADGIEFSFVRDEADVAHLQETLAQIRPDDWQSLSLILKIENAAAVRNLPGILMRAAARQPVAIMIARGDLAIEIGFARLAEMQEEILWIGEAAQVPVIWATQVMEQYVKEGLPSRGELTDAAMAVRADCVMLNKGHYLLEAIDALDMLLGRMADHVHKKTPQLRRLLSW